MDRSSFLAAVRAKGIGADAYSIGVRRDESYVLEHSLMFSVFYCERGVRTDLRRFWSESAALADLLARLDRDRSTRAGTSNSGMGDTE